MKISLQSEVSVFFVVDFFLKQKLPFLAALCFAELQRPQAAFKKQVGELQ